MNAPIRPRTRDLNRREFLQWLGTGAIGLGLAGRGFAAVASQPAGTGRLRGIFPIAQTPFTAADKLDVAVHKRDGAPYDYHRLLHTFRVKSRIKDVGIYRPKHSWEFSPGVKFKPLK